jgi:3-oxoacyl-[acyl-carrier-protein] synthase II
MKVYITGMGAVSPIGMNAEESFEAAAAGVSGISRPESFDAELTQIFAAGQVKNFTPEPYVSKREAKRMARFTQMAIVAAVQAWEQSGMQNSGFDAERVGVVLGSGMGGLDVICPPNAPPLLSSELNGRGAALSPSKRGRGVRSFRPLHNPNLLLGKSV